MSREFVTPCDIFDFIPVFELPYVIEHICTLQNLSDVWRSRAYLFCFVIYLISFARKAQRYVTFCEMSRGLSFLEWRFVSV